MFSRPTADHVAMTLTIAIIVNAVLMVGIVAAVARMIHLPYRDRARGLHLQHAVYVQGVEENELSRAA